MATMSNCNHCGKAVASNLDNCPYCGGFQRQGTPAPSAPQPAGKERSQTCPSCDALIQPGDIICVACGTNLLTGQKVAEEKTQPQAPPKGINWVVIGAVIGVLVLIGILVAIFMTLTSDPVARALELEKGNRASEAIQILERHVTNNNGDIRAYKALGRMYWNIDQKPQAADAYERVVQLDGTQRDAAMLAVSALATKTDRPTLDRQASILETTLTQSTDDADAWLLKAVVESGREDLAAQTEALQNVVRIEPNNARARQALAAVLAMAGRTAEARAQVEQTGMDATTTTILGTLSHMDRDNAGATYHFDQAAPSLSAEVRTAVRLQQGLLAMVDGQTEEAGFIFREARQSDSGLTARYFDAVSSQMQGRNAEAQPEFRDIVDRGGPYAAEAGLRMAEIYLAEGSYDLAKAAVDRAEREGASGPALHTLRGRVMVNEGDMAGAQSQFNRAVAIDPNFAPAYLEKGLAYVQRGLTEEGIRELDRYLQIADPSIPGMRVNEIQAVADQLRKAMGSR